jgi:hypothetical protein
MRSFALNFKIKRLDLESTFENINEAMNERLPNKLKSCFKNY